MPADKLLFSDNSKRRHGKGQTDILLRKDLRKFCVLYSQYGKDSILLAASPITVVPVS